ncbi:MAG: hypothetical protein QGH25_18520 [Candidatus Latescibacteria bacterium]|nr:hypothetical protein [Candidatus Latescibacterota bacterium]
MTRALLLMAVLQSANVAAAETTVKGGGMELGTTRQPLTPRFAANAFFAKGGDG